MAGDPSELYTSAFGGFGKYGNYREHKGYAEEGPIEPAPDMPNSLFPTNAPLCRFFQQGYCSRGERCSYMHIAGHTIPVSNVTRPLPVTQQYLVGQQQVPYQMLQTPSFNQMMPGYTYPTGQHFNAPVGFAIGVPNPKMFPPPLNIAQPRTNHSATAPQRMKKTFSEEVQSRYAHVKFETLVGEIYSLCKDQHGCRYLQKRLEEGAENHRDIIFSETCSHLAELMTDSFGNYLCQKMIEVASDEQLMVIIDTVASEIINICLNMHGTRAVQKLIEHVRTPQQTRALVTALGQNPVALIKDLNGNHCIQKCLTRLSPESNNFIFNAVTKQCIDVATHRHGCCVLQRCLDHASESQKVQLVTEITYHALTLVQDPFANYVVQYILDLGDTRFTDALVRRFIGNVCLLSVQKFSSNVVEKCIRVADPETRRSLVDELLNKERLDKLLRDSYANYVVQTALDSADPIQKQKLIDCIKPLLPAIRHTPYGKRIQNKLSKEGIPTGTNGYTSVSPTPTNLPSQTAAYSGNDFPRSWNGSNY
ncbi:ARM repeat-containing protein [Gonapodya prolifera JEL478]|uniref:ARM repeat-containing protein n=1 Tax=Gonapodya prolifera (strain JEL478) TaxID=1344416 RepID=A0A139AEJ7_GONPJ|nr:ARM repeat-containing protein [Gonapodya prolifera JEL478]|eukprot:KXS15099.1 ARM repeat-containing protein [Gonapodya prolifera JEL478]